MSLNFMTLREYVEMHHPQPGTETLCHRLSRWKEDGTILRTLIAVSFIFMVVAPIVCYSKGVPLGKWIEPWGTIYGIAMVSFCTVCIFEMIRAYSLTRRVGLLLSNRINQLN